MSEPGQSQSWRPSPYAPAQNGVILPHTTGLHETELKLFTTTAQREIWERLADIYSIIISLEYLEKAYVRDTITQTQYSLTCHRLLSQYRSILRAKSVANQFVNLDEFMKTYNVNCPSAAYRLQLGIPATVEHPPDTGLKELQDGVPQSTKTNPKDIAEAVQHFITLMDALKLKYTSKDWLHPLLSSLMLSLNNVTSGEFEGRAKIVQWLITLNKMEASDKITEQQSRQVSLILPVYADE